MSPQELLALESLSSLCLICPFCQLPDAMVTSGWHSLRRLEFDIRGEEDATVLEQLFDAIASLPHLEYRGCCLESLPAQFSALNKLRELMIWLPDFEVCRSQVSTCLLLVTKYYTTSGFFADHWLACCRSSQTSSNNPSRG